MGNGPTPAAPVADGNSYMAGAGLHGHNRQGIEQHQVRRAFGRAASGYDQAARLQRAMAKTLLERLDYIRIEPRRILDVGAGTGWLSEQLGKKYPKARVMALDLAMPMLWQVQKRGRWLRRIPCLCARTEAIPLADASLDMLISNAMLQWCANPQAVFAEWLRVLRPGGLLLFTSFGPLTLQELGAAWAQVDGLPHVHGFVDMPVLGDGLMGAGWENPVLDRDLYRLHYPDALRLMRDIKSLGAGNALSGRRASLTGKGRLQAVASAYEAMREPAGLPLSYEVFNGHAWAPQIAKPRPIAQVRLDSIG